MKHQSKRNLIVAGIVAIVILVIAAGIALVQPGGMGLFGTSASVALKISPPNPTVAAGQTVTLSVAPTLTNCQWSADTAAVSLSPASGTSTVASGVSAGTAKVTVTCSAGTGSTTVTVTPPPTPTPAPYPPPRFNNADLYFSRNLQCIDTSEVLINLSGDPNCTWTVSPANFVYFSGSGDRRTVSVGSIYGEGTITISCPASGSASIGTVLDSSTCYSSRP